MISKPGGKDRRQAHFNGGHMSKKKEAWFRVIGDVHGKHSQYVGLANRAEYSICVGDVGFDYSYLTKNLDADKHKIIGGNHDNYENQDGKFIKQTPHFLGDFGYHALPGAEPFFYVRGAWSIDQKYRKEGRDWWPEEELTYLQGLQAIETYAAMMPKVVISHCCPASIIPKVPFERLFGNEIFKTRTDTILELMYEFHQPDLWIFGHYHIDWDHVCRHKSGKKTRFICLNELSYKDFPKAEEIEHEGKDVTKRVDPEPV